MGELNNTWTPARIGMLQELWGSGLSAKQIAARLGSGITRNAVIGKAHRLGLSSRPSPIRRVDGKSSGVMAAAAAPMKTRLSTPKAMGLRRDMGGRDAMGHSYMAAASAKASAFAKDSQRDEQAHRAAPTSYAPRIFKSSQPAVQAQAQQCRWPMGDPLKAGFHFCESTSIPGLPYCYDHACVAYQGSKKKSPSAPREDAVVAVSEVAEAAVFGAVNNS